MLLVLSEKISPGIMNRSKSEGLYRVCYQVGEEKSVDPIRATSVPGFEIDGAE